MLALLIVLALHAAPSEELARAQRHYDDLAFDKAATILSALVERDLPDATRERALLLLGFCEILLGQTAAAQGHFRAVLTRSPRLVLPGGLSPKLTRVLEGVRAEVLLAPRMTPRTPLFSAAPAAGAVRLSFDAENVVAEQEPALRYRLSDEPVFSAAPLVQQSAGQWFAELPARASGATLEFFVDAKIANVRVPIFASQKAPERTVWPAAERSAEPIVIKASPASAPASIPTAPVATATPVTQRWWFWTILAGAAVAIAGATTAAVLSQQPPAADIRVVGR